MIVIPKALVQGLGLKEGELFDWQVINGGFKVLKVKNDANK